MKEREIKIKNKRIEGQNEREEVEVPEILQLSDAELQKKNMLELVEKRAREANERIARSKKKKLSQRAQIIEEEKKVKKAATLVQSAIRRRLARKRIAELRSKALMRETRMDFNKYIRVRVKKGEEGKNKQPEIDLENGMKILEEYMWESKQLIRDLCLDWWKERKEKAVQLIIGIDLLEDIFFLNDSLLTKSSNEIFTIFTLDGTGLDVVVTNVSNVLPIAHGIQLLHFFHDLLFMLLPLL